MTYEEKVRWLRRYQDSLRREQELAEEVEQLRSRACKVTPSLSGMPGGTSDGQQLPKSVEEILQAQEQLIDQIKLCNNTRREIISKINEIKNPTEITILRKKYILGQNFEDIAFDIGYSVRWCVEIHKRVILTLKISP